MEKTPDLARPKRRLWGIVAVLAMAASVVFIAPASAVHDEANELPPGVEFVKTKADGTEIYKMPTLFFYDNTTGEQLEFAVMIGGDLWDACGARPGNEGGTPATSKVLVKEIRNGKYVVKSPPRGHSSYISVYRTEMPPPVFFGEVCGGFFENGDPIPPPFASGFGTVHHKSWVSDVMEVMNDSTPQPRGRYRNGVEGVVVDANGTVYDVQTVAVFGVRDPNAIPEFDTLTATLTPREG